MNRPPLEKRHYEKIAALISSLWHFGELTTSGVLKTIELLDRHNANFVPSRFVRSLEKEGVKFDDNTRNI